MKTSTLKDQLFKNYVEKMIRHSVAERGIVGWSEQDNISDRFRKAYSHFAAPALSPNPQSLKDSIKDSPEQARIIFDTYLEWMEPVNVPARLRNKILPWIFDRLDEKHNGRPILTEDLTRLSSDVEYFYNRRSALIEAGFSYDINDYSYAELVEVIQPYVDVKNAKEQERLKYKMNEDDHRAIIGHTSILYDGEDGKIIVPHSIESCQYWGAMTRWCISSRTNNKFESYNKDGPILIYLPKPTEDERRQLGFTSFKFALVKNTFYDELDGRHFTPPQCLLKLKNSFMKTIHSSLGEYKDMLLGDYDYFNGREGLTSDNPITPHDISDTQKTQFDAAFDMVSQNGLAFYYLSQELRSNKDLAILAIQTHHGEAYEWISSQDTYMDDEVIAEAIMNGLTRAFGRLDEASEYYKTSVVGGVVHQPGLVKEIMSDYRQDKDFMTDIFVSNPETFRYFPEDLKNDRDFVRNILERHPTGILALYNNGRYEIPISPPEIEIIERRAVINALTSQDKHHKMAFYQQLHNFQIMQKDDNLRLFLTDPEYLQQTLAMFDNQNSVFDTEYPALNDQQQAHKHVLGM